jgi:predicted transcriptional regulator
MTTRRFHSGDKVALVKFQRYRPCASPFWKLEGSQYGILTTWASETGTSVNGVPISATKLADLRLHTHHSVKVRIGVKESAEHGGGINIFGKGFGNYDQDIILRLFFDETVS